MDIKSENRTIRQILQEGFYSIPRFQRPYSWDRDNYEDFWHDTIEEGFGEYFIGSFVCYERGKDTGSFGVVDGQQRLTTITLTLCAIRNVLSKRGMADLAQGIQNLIERKDIDNKSKYVLSTESSYPFFQEVIQKHGVPDHSQDAEGDEESNLQEAFKYLTDKVESQTDAAVDAARPRSKKAKQQAAKEALLSLRDRVLSLQCIMVRVGDEEGAYIIFETLNTRGKDLQVSDLVKNHLAKHLKATNSQVDRFRDKWAGMVGLFDEAGDEVNLNSYFHHYWLSCREYLPAKKLFKALKKVIDKNKANDFLDTLVREATWYRSLFEPDTWKWANEEIEMRQSLGAINQFKVVQAIPVLLSLFRAWQDGVIKLKVAKRAVRAIEHFHFMFTALTSSRSSGGISAMYSLHARQLAETDSSQAATKALDSLIKKLKDRVPVREYFELPFMTLQFGRRAPVPRRLAQYVLRKLFVNWFPNRAVDWTQYSVEHILPESSQSSSATDYLKYTIGNLLYIPRELNTKLDTKPFDEKQKILLKEGFIADDDRILRDGKAWGAKEIKQRGKYLASIAYNTVFAL